MTNFNLNLSISTDVDFSKIKEEVEKITDSLKETLNQNQTEEYVSKELESMIVKNLNNFEGMLRSESEELADKLQNFISDLSAWFANKEKEEKQP